MKLFPKSKVLEIVQQTIDDELLLCDLKSNRFFCLNQTSRKIYHLCDGTNEIVEIAEKTKLPENLVRLAVEGLSRQNLLTEKVEINASRRDLLRNMALTSIALPVITTLVAPTAARAASTCGTIPPGVSFTIPNNGGGTSSCFTAANDAECQNCRVNAASCTSPACTTIACTCR